MSSFFYYQKVGGNETWKPIQVSQRLTLELKERPRYVTALSLSKLVDDLSHEDKLQVKWAGPLYMDWDSLDIDLAILKFNQFLDKLEDMGVDLAMCYLYATGGRGFHLEIPQEIFMEKVPRTGTQHLPTIYKELVMPLAVDTMDLSVYSGSRGRMWRVVNVERENGRYKVPLTVAEVRDMSEESYAFLTKAARPQPEIKAAIFCPDLGIAYSKAEQKMETLMKNRAKWKPDPAAKEKAGGISIQMAMDGIGIKAGTGFQKIALQLAIAGVTAGWSEDRLIEMCAGIIANHQGDGNRYSSPEKRETELRRMYQYVYGHPGYVFSVGAIKAMLTHAAPDLDGIKATREEVEEIVKEAAAEEAGEVLEVDEYGDVAKGVTLNKYGVYVDTEAGKKRVCSLSFADVCLLRLSETCQIACYQVTILVNGERAQTQTLDLDIFQSLMAFNKFAAKYGHAFQGTDSQVRQLMMRLAEKAKRSSNMKYTVSREGLSMLTIPDHPNPLFHEPFMVWATKYGCIVPAQVAEADLALEFVGYPSKDGAYKSDLTLAPDLATWAEEPRNRAAMRDMLMALFTCQKPDFIGKSLGWFVACFYRQLLHKLYKQFPALHLAGQAGLGKSAMTTLFSRLHYWKQEAKILSPSSSAFAIKQSMCASSSDPFILDEFKPTSMKPGFLDEMRAIIRDAYNMRQVQRGGGNKANDNFQALQELELSAPIVFIAESLETEPAVMERVVMANLTRPAASVYEVWRNRFRRAAESAEMLGILGKYLMMEALNEVTLESLQAEFGALLRSAESTYMLTEADMAGGASEEVIKQKSRIKSRMVYNHAVALFGIKKLRAVLKAIYQDEFEEVLQEFEDNAFARLDDLAESTTPEYIKVLKTFATMSVSFDSSHIMALTKGKDYAFGGEVGRETIEIAIKHVWWKYLGYISAAKETSAFANVESFEAALRDSTAYRRAGPGEGLEGKAVIVLDLVDLYNQGVDAFKGN